MPIRIPNELPATQTLTEENIFVMTETRAMTQDIRPLQIALVNLMPTKIDTETQLARLLSNTPLQVELELVCSETHVSKNTPREHMLAFYKHFGDIKDRNFDGLIITGAPVEQMPFEEVEYWDELCTIMEWSKTHVHSTFHICWGAQAGLYYHYGIQKVPLEKKLFGVFPHIVERKSNMLFRGSDDVFMVPHSRHTTVRKEDILKVPSLKILAGLDPHQQFKVDVTHADDLLRDFDGTRLRWDERWNETEDNLLLRTQIKLADYNIMLAWAQYVPNMTISVNMNPPRGQAQPSGGTADQFLHLTFDFPLIDWGRRYRDVQTARMTKAQAFHSLAEKRFDYQNKWLQAEQQMALALTNLKLAHNRYQTARMQYEEARIAFENGLEALPLVADRQENMVQAQINYINTELDYRLAKLDWMHVSGLLQKRFLGLPDREMNKLVGGMPAVSDPAAVPAAEEKVFPDMNKPAGDVSRNTRLIGHAEPMKLDELPAADPAADPDLKAVPTIAQP